MIIAIHELATHAEFAAAELFQRDVWGMPERGVVPAHMLLTAQKNGGVVLGAYDLAASDPQRLIAYLFSFIGLDQQGHFKHCSHQLAVDPHYRGQSIGTRMKLYQRELVLQQGITLMTWTYDPLECRNATLNLHRLGAVSKTYLPNLYGEMADALNAGLPSDRLLVAWHLASPRVQQRSERGMSPPARSVQQWQAAGAVLLNPVLPPVAGLIAPAGTLHAPHGPTVLVAIPAHFRRIREHDPQRALAWRMQIRTLLEQAFAAGYTATDLLRDGELGYYVLERDWTGE